MANTITVAATLQATNTLAGFNDWGQRLNSMLSSIGLTQTADTGQINWSTNATTPSAVNTMYGYEIWRFNDTLQATAPIYLKISYGTGSTAGGVILPTCQITIGTGSNGAGTITGIWFGPASIWQDSWTTGTIVTTSTDYRSSWAVYNPTYGCLGIVFYPNFISPSTSNIPTHPIFYLQLARTVDQVTGLPNGEGAFAHIVIATGNSGAGLTNASSPTISIYNFATGLTFALGNTTTHVPGSITSTGVPGSGLQVYRQGYSLPKLGYLSQFCSVLPNEYPWGTIFTATLFNGVPLQYIALGNRAAVSGQQEFMTAANQQMYSAMLWQ